MAFLKTLFWIVLTAVIVVFSVNNWVTIDIGLFGNLVWQTKLPVPLMLAFLLGFVPLYIYHRTVRWRSARALPPTTVVPPPTAAPSAVPEPPPEPF